MKFRISVVAFALLAGLFASPPSRLQAQHAMPSGRTASPPPAADDMQVRMQAMMATMHASDQRLDELVNKMNSASGPAKTDAMAALLTALVEDHRAMHASMGSNMSMMMNMGHMMRGRETPPTATPPKKE
jgi:hypothetical protein